jgi:hypothetical protein
MDAFTIAAFIAIPLLITTFSIRYAIKRFATTKTAWRAAAQQLGVVARERPMQLPSLHGTIGDVEVAVTHHSSDNSRYVAFKGTYPTLGVGLKITKDNTFKKLFGQLVGSDDIEIDDTRADEMLRIDGRDETAVKAFMTPQKMAAIGDAIARYPSMKITDTEISFRVAGSLATTEDIVTHVNALTEAAQALRGSAIHRSMLSDSPIHESAVTSSPIHSGKHEEPVDDSAATVRPHPDDAPQLSPTNPQPATPRQSAVGTPLPVAAEVPPTASQADAQKLAEEMFLGTRVSFVVEEAFESGYAGKQIRWQGTVRSMRPYTSDHHFGETPGVKIVVMVAEVVHDLYGRTKIDVVAALPAGTPDIDRGDPVTISGTLDELDVPKRSIYLTDARLG